MSQPDSDSAPTLLVADDDEYVRYMFNRVASRAGWELEEAVSYDEVLEKVLAAPGAYRAIILDVEMPGPKAETVIERIRAAGCGAGIVIASGMPACDRKSKLEDMVDGHFLTKPFQLQDLVNTLEPFRTSP